MKFSYRNIWFAIFAVFSGAMSAGAASAPDMPATSAPLQELNISWTLDTRISGHAVAAYPHPSMTQRILLATDSGLMISENGGDEWQKLPAADIGKIGKITCVAFVPDKEDSFYAGTAGKGVWFTEDCGKTFKQIGSASKGMASDSVSAFYIFPGDQLFHTLIAAHGDAAAGISRSVNKGETWSFFATDYHVSSIQFRDFGCYDALIVASKKDSPEIKSICYGISIDDYWYDAMKDVVPTGSALPLFKAHPIFSTLDQGMVFVSKSDLSKVGPKDAGFTSVGVTWGRTAEEQLMYSYDPKKLGMVATFDAYKTWSTQSAGLYTGDFTKEGAHIRANSNGSVFYAVANGNLYVGKQNQKGAGVAISSIKTTPSVFEFAGTMYRTKVTSLKQNISRFQQSKSAVAAAAALKVDIDGMKEAMTAGQYSVTAKVSSRDKPKAVTIDLRSIGGGAKTAMYDDGKHSDGKADDGIFGTTFRVDPWRLRNDDKMLKRWPGQIGLTLNAESNEGKVYAAVAPLDIYSMPEAFEFYRSRSNMRIETEGPVTGITTVPAGEAHGKPEECFKLDVKTGTWQATIGGGGLSDITGYYAISFWIKSSTDSTDDVLLQMRDSPMYMDPTATEAEGISDPAYIESGMVLSDWQRVVIPISNLLQGSPDFRSTELGSITFSGNCTAPVTYWISEVIFHVNQNEIGKVKTTGIKKRKR